MPARNTVENFWSKVIKSAGGCWEWTGHKLPFGYGHICWGQKMTLTHRLSWRLTYGEIPEGLCVLHKCDNPSCVRPDHLFLGTYLDNNRDMAAKGRSQVGSQKSSARFDEEQVLKIRAEYIRGVFGYRKLAAKYEVAYGTIFQIINRLRWKHI